MMRVTTPSIRPGRILVYVILIAALVLTLGPFIWVITASLRTTDDLLIDPFSLPIPPLFENYVVAWTRGSIGRFFVNSIVITVPSVIITVVVCSLAGYAFARIRFPGRPWLMILFLLGLTVPAEAYIIPLTFQMRDLGLLNNPWSVVLAYVALVTPIGTVIMRSFFADIPSDYEDAARLDGCDELDLFRRIMMPLVMPGVITLAILSTVWSWNDFLHPFLFLTRGEARTLPTAIVAFQGERGEVQLTTLLAAAVMSFAPILVLYVVLQRRFVQGFAGGALKG